MSDRPGFDRILTLVTAAVVLGACAAVALDKGLAVMVTVLTFCFALFGLPVMAGLCMARGRRAAGMAGYLATVIALVTLFLGFMDGSVAENVEGEGWRTAYVLMFFSLGLGQVTVILNLARSDDAAPTRFVRAILLFLIAVLAVLGIAESAESGPDVDPRIFAVLGVLYVSSALLLSLIHRARRPYRHVT